MKAILAKFNQVMQTNIAMQQLAMAYDEDELDDVHNANLETAGISKDDLKQLWEHSKFQHLKRKRELGTDIVANASAVSSGTIFYFILFIGLNHL